MVWRPRPDTHAARIVTYLLGHPDGASDGELEQALGNGVSHQTINITCRALESRGILFRKQDVSPKRNVLTAEGIAICRSFRSTTQFPAQPVTSDAGNGDNRIPPADADAHRGTLRPNTHYTRIIECLRLRPDGMTDRALAEAVGISQPAVNQRCRVLRDRGLLVRQQVDGRFRNYVCEGNEDAGVGTPKSPRLGTDHRPTGKTKAKPWFWEGKVQSAAVKLLAAEGWEIQRVANTERREPGKDIECERHGTVLWVTAKGFPEGTERTHPNTQARHWFSNALMDVILWREENPMVHIAVALPQNATYQNLATRTSWFQRAAGFSYIWVTEDGANREKNSLPDALDRV